MSDEQVLTMPIRRFWSMSRDINRISAEESLRAFSIARNATNTEKQSVEDFVKNLEKSMGEVYKVDRTKERLDRGAWERLKSMG